MNCQRLRQHVQASQHGVLNLDHFSAEMLAHLNVCVKCKNSIEEWCELAIGLQRIRDSAPEVPRSLDSAVLLAFRRRLVTARRGEIPVHKRTGRVAIYSATGALLAAAAVVVFLTLPGKTVAPNIQTSQASQHMAAIELPVSASTTAPQAQIKEATAHGEIRKQPFRRAAISAEENVLPSGFTSLMYCDQLSCAGEMQVVRVQLSPSMLGLPPDPHGAANAVLADVLVGQDGIARGIRLEQ